MAYTQFDPAVPVTTQSRQDTVDSSRANLTALRDMILMGYAPGWSMTPGDSSSTAAPTFTATLADASQPQILKYVSGTEEILAWITWTSGNATTIKFYYSPDNSGGGYPANRDSIGQENIGYDGDSNVNGITWT